MLDIAMHMLVAIMSRRVFVLDAASYHIDLDDYLAPPTYDWRLRAGPS